MALDKGTEAARKVYFATMHVGDGILDNPMYHAVINAINPTAWDYVQGASFAWITMVFSSYHSGFEKGHITKEQMDELIDNLCRVLKGEHNIINRWAGEEDTPAPNMEKGGQE